MDLYRRPLLYDVAFTWEFLSIEIDRLQQCFATFAAGPVRRLLEPACGTGRFLLRWPELGYRVTGYDRSPGMLAFARERLRTLGPGRVAGLVAADMRSAAFAPVFDAAYNAVNSIGYLLADEDLRSHLAVTARSLRPGGVYVVQISCAHEEDEEPEPPDEWTCERDGLRVSTVWRVVREDRRRRLSHQVCRMEVEREGEVTVFEEAHTVRLMLDRDFRRLVGETGLLRHAGIVDFEGNEIPLTTRVTGGFGNLYHVLRRT
jgi:SAM-dependent methyltransferase